jgi:quercetin dioxygenase-like cupin family protein
MLTRRGMFVGCAVCAMAGFSAEAAEAPGPKRTVLEQHDGPMPGYETIEQIVDIPAGTVFDWHVHPGNEIGYVLTGSVQESRANAAPVTHNVGDHWLLPKGTLHRVQIGSQPARVLASYCVEKGLPLLIPMRAPA